MRGSKSIIVVAMSLICFANVAHADHHLEGVWESDRNQIVLTIETIKEGIRVKRTGQNRWYEYLEYRENQFRDSQGNIYYLLGDNTLEWEDKSGKKRLRFQKKSNIRQHAAESRPRDSQDNWDAQEGARDRDNYIERNHYYGHQGQQASVSTHSLDGRWINQTTGQVISVKSKNNTLRIKAHRGGWETFYRKDGNTFIDSHGNRYDAHKNELSYSSRRADFYMTFRRF
ncbi:MAG: hypothetical protein IPL46_34155 [Saprospiraceae bacterium]|nr:hypothetical protein [Saprospiraceae bacterium]